MRPFSPLYYVKENKSRCFLLMFMLFLAYAAYLGGLYVTNPYDNWSLAIDYSDKVLEVYPSNDDEGQEDFYAFTAEAEQNEMLEVLQLGVFNAFNWNTIMAFESGSFSLTFLSVEDFRTYCEHMGIECDFDKLGEGSLVMSERFAKNRGLRVGDVLGKDFSNYMYGEFRLDAVTQEDGYTLYFIDGESGPRNDLLIFGRGVSDSKAEALVDGLRQKYDVRIAQPLRSIIERQYGTFNQIYFFVVILVAIILAVTINAAFIGMYERRKPEFAVYRAIGISKRRILGKIVGELLCMDAIALVLGGAVFFFGLYLFNNLALYPVGKYLRYFQPFALFGLLLCNLAVLVPLIVTRCRQMGKADICEY